MMHMPIVIMRMCTLYVDCDDEDVFADCNINDEDVFVDCNDKDVYVDCNDEDVYANLKQNCLLNSSATSDACRLDLKFC